MNYIIRSFSYLKNYKPYLFLNLVTTIIVAFLEIFSLLSIVPLLDVLFAKENVVKAVAKPTNFSFFPLKNGITFLKDYLAHLKYSIFSTYEKPQLLVYICVGIFLVFLLKNCFVFLDQILDRTIKYNVERDERTKLYDTVLNLPISFFSEQKRADVLTYYSKDIVNVQQAVLGGYKLLFKQPIMILFFIFSMLMVSTKLTLFVFILIPVVGLFISRISKSLKKRSHAAKGTEATLLGYLDETIYGTKIIKAFNAEKYLKEKFEKENSILNKIIKQIEFRQAASSPISEILGIAIVMFVMWFGGQLILSESSSLTPNLFIAFIILFARLIEPVKALSNLYSTLSIGMASADRLSNFYKVESEFKSQAKKEASFNNTITFNNVSFSYPKTEKEVISNFNLTLHKNKTVALVGQSGAGKSTIADLLPRFYDITKGEILIDGNPIQDYSKKSIRDLMSYVSQESILLNDTVLNNISFGTNATKQEVIEAAKIANAHDFIVKLENGYQTNVGDRGGKLSGGQKQRITIARAILKKASILILDEATSALDTESERLVQDAIEKLLQNRTAIVIAHRLSTIKNADCIYVMHEGVIVENGTHQELITIEDGYYKKLTEMQSLN